MLARAKGLVPVKILVLAAGIAAEGLWAQATDPGELKYIQATGVSGFVIPSAGTSELVTFEYSRSGYNIKLQIPRKTTAGTFSPITGLLTLKEAVPIRMEVTGTAQIDEILTVHEPTSNCRASQLVRRGAAVNIPLSCSLNRLHRTNTSAGHAIWNLEVVSDERPKILVATPHYTFPFPPAGCPTVQSAARGSSAAEDLVCTPPDIAIDAVTAIQVIQDEEGRIPLVPGKATVVRIFAKSLGASPRTLSITGTLMVNGDDDTCHNRMIPTNDRFGFAVPRDPDHGDARASIEFLLPPECTKAGPLAMAAEISMTDPEVNKENNRMETGVVFQKALEFVPLTLDYWSVCMGNQWCPEMYDAHERIQTMLPIGDGRANFTPIHMLYPPLTWPGIKSFADFENFARLQLFLDRIMTRLRGAGSVYKLWTAVPGSGSPEILRISDLSVFDWCQTDRDCYARNSWEFAESMVHYFTKRLPLLESPPEIVAHYNSRTNEIIPGHSIPLNEGGWITAQQYLRTMARLVAITEGYNAISGPPPPPPPAIEVPVAGALANPVTPEAPASEVETLVITGFVRRDGSSARLEPAFRNSLSAADPSDAEGKWCLRYRRTGQPADAETCFAVEFAEGSEQAAFAVEIPWYSDTASVTLVHRDAPENELARLNAGDPIDLRITSPGAGEVWEGRQSLTWAGVESAGRSLTYMVLYSSDGGTTWLPLATDWTETTMPIDTTRLAGGKEVRLRVVASSGLTNAVVDVGPFEIRQRPQLRVVSGPLADLGNRRTGEAAQVEIVLRNEGTGPLSLWFGIPPGVPFSLPFEGTGSRIAVPAGQERKVMVRYWPQSAGQHQSELTLSGNGMEDQRVTLQGAAYDREVPGIVVPSNFDFGRLAVGSTRELPFPIRNAGEAALTLQSLVSGSTAFQIVTPVSGMEIAPGASAAILVRVRVTSADLVAGRLTIRSNDPRLAAVDVAVSATGIVPQGGSIDLAPGTLDFGSVAVNSTRTADLTIANLGTAPLTIHSAASSSARFTLTSPALPVTIAPGAQRVAVIRFAPVTAGSEQATLVIASDDPVMTSSVVNLRGVGTGGTVAAPVISVSASSLDFGSVTQGSSATRTLTISNTGTAPLAVSGLVTSAPFTVTPASIASIAAGASATVTVTFAPSAAGAVSRNMTISSNDTARGTLTVSLSGTGTAAPAGPPANFAGQWTTTSSGLTYTLNIAQNGANVTGTYPQYNGTIAGTVTGNTLNGTWSQPGSAGTLVFVLASDGNSFSGTWTATSGASNSGTWTGVRAAAGGASIGVSATTIDFGSVTPGTSSSRNLTISNTGSAALVVSSLATSAPFTVGTSSIASIAPGASSTVSVTFAPAAVGAVSRTLTIASNDPARGTVTVTLNGTGSAAPSGPPGNFAGQWTATSGGNTYALNVTQTGANVSGTYPQFNGTINGTVNGNALTGNWADLSGNGTFVFNLSSDGNTFNGTWVRTSGAGGNGTWTGVRVNTGGTVLSIDDGTYENVIGFPQGGVTAYFVNRLTPARYPATLRAVQIRFPLNELPAGTAFSVIAAPHTSGTGGTPITNVAWQSTAAQIVTVGQFVEYTIPSITINSGDFLVGFAVANPANIWPASLDSTPPARLRSYIGTNAASIRYPSDANQGNLAIRARVE